MKNIRCSFYGHELQQTKKITNHISEYKCLHCRKLFTTSSTGEITTLSEERKEINSMLEKVYLKKLKRNRKQSALNQAYKASV